MPSLWLGLAGQLLHAGLNENHKDYHYSLSHAGRTYNEQVAPAPAQQLGRCEIAR